MVNVPRHGVLAEAVKRKIQAPCKDCNERHLKCHSTCKRYAECAEQKSVETLKAYKHYETERKCEKKTIEGCLSRRSNRNRNTVNRWDDYRK